MDLRSDIRDKHVLIVGAMYYDGGLENEGKIFGFRGGPIVFAGNFETGNLLRWTSSMS